MLVKLVVSNFLSFKDPVEFSMEKLSKVRQHPQAIIDGLLRGACIYGANNSGKTNLIRAIHFIVKAIKDGNISKVYKNNYSFIPNDNKNSRFELTFRKNKNDYKYVLECGIGEIAKEELYIGNKTVFKRASSDVEKLSDYGLLSDIPYYIQRKFTKTDLFLSKLYDDNVLGEPNLKHQQIFKEVKNWFNNVFCVMLNAHVGNGFYVYMNHDGDFKDYLRDLLEKIDTSINKIDWEKVHGEILKTILSDMPESMKDDSANEPDTDMQFFVRKGYDFYTISKDINNEFQGKKLYTYHNNERFELDWESDGTKKIIELSLAFYLLKTSDVVVLIDELDSSLHPIMTRYLLNDALNSTHKSQIITTLHNINLLSQEIWRVDQIWFVEKYGDGVSHLYSLQQFAPRFDKNILNDYIQGKYGSIPTLGVWKW